MKKKFLKDLNIDKTWALFLDRDGVINYKIDNVMLAYKFDCRFEFVINEQGFFYLL